MKLADLPTATRWAAAAVAGLMLILVWDQQYWWSLREEYSFGYLVPIFVAFVLYDRWPKIAHVFAQTGDGLHGIHSSGASFIPATFLWIVSFLMVLSGLFFFLAGMVYRAMEGPNLITSNLLALGFAGILIGVAYLYSGSEGSGEGAEISFRVRSALLFLFPAVIWILSVPMFNAIERNISTFLMNRVAMVVYTTFDLLGYAVIREGSVLKLPLGDVGVEDACSGIRSLTACLFAGSFLGAVYFTEFWKKLLLVFTAMLFAFLNNILRSLFLTAWAYARGPGALDEHVVAFGMDLGNIHDFTGWLVLGLTVICLLVLVRILSIRLETEAVPANDGKI